MAQRDRDKAVKRAPAATAARVKGKDSSAASGTMAAGTTAADRLDAKIKALEQERDSLKAELDTARLKIAALDQSRRQAADRIEWIIDSLHSLIDKDA